MGKKARVLNELLSHEGLRNHSIIMKNKKEVIWSVW